MSSNGSTGTSTPLSDQDKSKKVSALLRGEEKSAGAKPPLVQPPADEGTDENRSREPGEQHAPRPNEQPGLEFEDDDDEGQEEQEKLTKKQQKTLRDFAAEHGFSVKALMG